MFYTGLFKRVIPFVLTFAAGLFVASFFVSLAVPDLTKWREARREARSNKHWHQKNQIRMEMDELRETIRLLKEENAQLRRSATEAEDAVTGETPFTLDAPPPPPPLRVRGKGTGYGSGTGSSEHSER